MLHFDRSSFEARETFLTSSLLWIREHRGASRKVIHWGHQEHIGKLPTRYLNGRPSMGTRLAEQLGPEYVAIGMLAGSGTVLQWKNLNGAFVEAPLTLPDPADANLYEWHFRQRGIPALLIPLRGKTIPGTSFRTAGTTSGYSTETQPLTQKLDAVIYIDRTTPTNALR
jgi:erythromycin esterase-like protein